MNVSQASKIWLDYHRAHSKENTVRAYEFTIAKFNLNFENLTRTSRNQKCLKLRSALSAQPVFRLTTPKACTLTLAHFRHFSSLVVEHSAKFSAKKNTNFRTKELTLYSLSFSTASIRST